MRIYSKNPIASSIVLMFSLLFGLTGCVTNVYDKKQEGQTKMDGLICNNGVCNKDPSEKTFKYWTKEGQKDAAPEPVPNNPPPNPYNTLPVITRSPAL